MVFSSAFFLFAFLPLALVLYRLAPVAWRNTVLMLVSLAFYTWGEREYAWVLLASIAGNYLAALWIGRAPSPVIGRRRAAVAVAANLLLLFAFKYANFVSDNLNIVLRRLGVETIHLEPMHLPIGISFFTFQAIAYVVDVATRAVPVERSPIRYALYAALFPHLVAGPIVRYRDIADQLASRTSGLDQFASGVRRFVVGLAKKVLLANTLATTADAAFGRPDIELSAGAAWLGLICYSMQIYFDFSGYSDMAIGLGRMFGFEFLENFRHPYTAKSVTDFWRRWHISLSSWLRDYVYIPLGGNRASPRRVLINLMVVFVLCGLWHGAAWTFLLWGLWHGAFLIVERVGLADRLANWPTLVQRVYTLLAVAGGWVLFRADTVGDARRYFRALFGLRSGLELQDLLTVDIAVALIVGVAASFPLLTVVRRKLAEVRWHPEAVSAGAELAFCSAMLGLSVWLLAAGSYQPFLYFRF